MTAEWNPPADSRASGLGCLLILSSAAFVLAGILLLIGRRL